MRVKRFILLLFLTLLLGMAYANGESARVITPGGPVNARKSDSTKAAIIMSIPNGSMVEVLQGGAEWTRILYGKKEGYVKTEFLRLSGDLPGKRIFADTVPCIARKEPGEDSPIAAVLGAYDSFTVEQIVSAYARVRLSGGTEGYVPLDQVTYQYEEVQHSPLWIPVPAVLVHAQALRLDSREDARVLETLEQGSTVTATYIENGQCIVRAQDGQWGYLPLSALALSEPADAEAVLNGMDLPSAALMAEEYLHKQVKASKKETLYGIVSVTSPGLDLENGSYSVAFLNEDDQIRYAVLVDPVLQKAVFAADYTDFALPVRESALLPRGEMTVACEKTDYLTGETADVCVSAWTEAGVRFRMERNGKTLFDTDFTQHFNAAYRFKEAGDYCLEVTVRDEDGLKETRTLNFSVTGEPEENLTEDVYSQKDGWWKPRKYSRSTLQISGCAIFTLSHALQRLGLANEEADPESLASIYAQCLTGEGTNNERLIREASGRFGFKTQKNLITDASVIREYLSQGAVFSFSVCRGHIALVSGPADDETMVHITDSAPGATFERIRNASVYILKRPGVYRAVRSPDQIPGMRWYMDTEEYGGAEYYMTLDYVSGRGVRLIMKEE